MGSSPLLHSTQMSALRTNRTCAVAAIADAALLCKRSRLRAVLQLLARKRSLQQILDCVNHTTFCLVMIKLESIDKVGGSCASLKVPCFDCLKVEVETGQVFRLHDETCISCACLVIACAGDIPTDVGHCSEGKEQIKQADIQWALSVIAGE